ncbi:Peptidase C39 like family protein [Histomonas meleagridis]|uniref:Peptidase C39 like family protein n=1 Tax=Histomonas meleagridis TaxID=135588 RepID=UPI00355A5C69|nr:Peptidase C39 like family protein [Histomonas meleagridis]KAH0806704.1 Peptidase C39 like family protein [Histomonas meleagridis]
MSSDYGMKMDMVKLISIIFNVLLLCVDIGLGVGIGLKETTTVYEQQYPTRTEVTREQLLDIPIPYYGEGNYSTPATFLFTGRDHLDSKYYTMLDYYNMESNDNLTIFSHFKTYSQTSEYTDMITVFNMVANLYGLPSYNETMLADLFDVGTDIRVSKYGPGQLGTPPEDLEYGIRQLGYSCRNKTTLPNFTDMVEKYDYNAFEEWIKDSINNKQPIIFLTVDWGSHYVIPIGLDTMGTETTADDVIIVADTYDTTDHRQDGYFVWGLERFFEELYIPCPLFNQTEGFSFVQIMGPPETN